MWYLEITLIKIINKKILIIYRFQETIENIIKGLRGKFEKSNDNQRTKTYRCNRHEIHFVNGIENMKNGYGDCYEIIFIDEFYNTSETMIL